MFNYGLVIVFFNTFSVSHTAINIVFNCSSETIGVIREKRINRPIGWETQLKNIKSN